MVKGCLLLGLHIKLQRDIPPQKGGYINLLQLFKSQESPKSLSGM